MATVYSDENGIYKVNALPFGEYIVTYESPGYKTHSEILTFTDMNMQKDIYLEQYDFSGKSLDLTYEITDTSVTFQPFSFFNAAGVQIDWGDGCVNNLYNHINSMPGIYTLKIVFDDLRNIAMNYPYNLLKIEGKFNNCENLYNLRGCFQHAERLTSISSKIFEDCSNLNDLSYCFEDCWSLTELPDGLFKSCTKVTEFDYCFNRCNKLVSIPAGLFYDCISATSFNSCFQACNSLATLPENYLIFAITQRILDHASIMTEA